MEELFSVKWLGYLVPDKITMEVSISKEKEHAKSSVM
jgi:hypothetical protein